MKAKERKTHDLGRPQNSIDREPAAKNNKMVTFATCRTARTQHS